MNFKQVQHFLHLYQTRNMTRSGKEMFISQQGLSRSIQNLEDELGFPLFIRSSAGMAPTSEAEKLYGFFLSIENSYEAFIQEAKRINAGTPLKIAAPQGLVSSLARTVFEEYKSLYSELHIQYEEYPIEKIGDLIRKGETELAYMPGPVGEEFHSHLVTITEPFYAVVDHHSPLAEKEQILPENLSGETLLIMDLFAGMIHSYLNDISGENYTLFDNVVHMTDFLPLIHSSELIGFSSKYLYRYVDFPYVSFIPLYYSVGKPVLIYMNLISMKGRPLSQAAEKYIRYESENVGSFS